MRQIDDQVGMNFSTVSRELRRNSTQTGYDQENTHQQSDIRKRTAIKTNKRFTGNVSVSEKTKVDVYVAKPYASWQRGTNENMNGQIRRFWPKKFDMTTQREKEIECRIF